MQNFEERLRTCVRQEGRHLSDIIFRNWVINVTNQNCVCYRLLWCWHNFFILKINKVTIILKTCVLFAPSCIYIYACHTVLSHNLAVFTGLRNPVCVCVCVCVSVWFTELLKENKRDGALCVNKHNDCWQLLRYLLHTYNSFLWVMASNPICFKNVSSRIFNIRWILVPEGH